MVAADASEIDLTDTGCPMPPSCRDRLKRVDLRGINLPYYGSNWGFFKIVNELTYRGFRGNLNEANKPRVLGRQVTEAAWVKTLTKYFNRWPAAEMLEKLGTPEAVLQARKVMLRVACNQRRGDDNDDVEAYWLERAKLWEGLDIECIPDDTDDDHSCLRKIGPNGSWYSSCNSDELIARKESREKNKIQENERYESGFEDDDKMDLDDDPNETIEGTEQASHGQTAAWVEQNGLIEEFEDMQMRE